MKKKSEKDDSVKNNARMPPQSPENSEIDFANLYPRTNEHLRQLQPGIMASDHVEVDSLQLRLPSIRQLYIDPKKLSDFTSDDLELSQFVGVIMSSYTACMNFAVARADAACRLAILSSKTKLGSISQMQRDYETALDTIAHLEAARTKYIEALDNCNLSIASSGNINMQEFTQLSKEFFKIVLASIETLNTKIPELYEISPADNQVQSPEAILAEMEGSFSVCLEQIQQNRKTTSRKEFGKADLSDLPLRLSQPTFIEAREAGTAISDGRDLRNWRAMEGMIAMLHCPQNARLQTRFEPSTLLLSWWGKSQGADLQTLQEELKRLDLEALVTFFVCLSWTIEEFQVTTSIDAIITAIGRGEDARRSSKERAKWRAKVWRWLALFDSLAVVGARPGIWREPRDGDDKRAKIEATELESHDALLKVMGYRQSEQICGQGYRCERR